MRFVELFCDGACSGNPGPGGWGVLLRCDGHEKEASGGEAQTTNNRMELQAVLSGLQMLKRPCHVRIVTDSSYVANGISKGWAAGWQRKGWRKSDGKPALNTDLWQALLSELAQHQTEIQWVRGHNGHPENERCDALATQQAKAQARKDTTKTGTQTPGTA